MNPSPKPITVGFGEADLAPLTLRRPSPTDPLVFAPVLRVCSELVIANASNTGEHHAQLNDGSAPETAHVFESEGGCTPALAQSSPKRTPVRFGEASTRLKAPAGSSHCGCAKLTGGTGRRAAGLFI